MSADLKVSVDHQANLLKLSEDYLKNKGDCGEKKKKRMKSFQISMEICFILPQRHSIPAVFVRLIAVHED